MAPEALSDTPLFLSVVRRSKLAPCAPCMGPLAHYGSGSAALRALLALQLLQLAAGQASPQINWQALKQAGWNTIRAQGSQLLTFATPAGNTTYAVARRVVAAGDVLAAGAANLQPSMEACAASCAALEQCSVFNWCGQVRACRPHCSRRPYSAQGGLSMRLATLG